MQPPFQYPSLTNRDQRTLAPGSYGAWRVGGAVLTETSTYSNPTYAQLPYSRLTLSGDYTLPPYTQDVWDRTRDAPSVSFVVIIQNNSMGLSTITPGVGWLGGSFQVSGGCCSLLLVLDNGTGATLCPIGSAAAISGSFTVSTTGPLTATSPVTLGGNLALNNTALNSIPNSSWKAGNSSTVGIGGFNIAVGELSIAGVNSVALGYQGAASINSVGIGYQANATGTGEVAIGYQAVAQQDDTIAIGRESLASGTNTVVIGRGGLANAANATGMGTGVQAIGTNSAAFGNAAGSNNSGTALGNQSFSGIEGVAVGSTSLSGNQGVAVGYNSQNNFPNGVAVGRQTRTDQDGVAVGYNATASTSGTSLGSGSVANALNATAIGRSSQATASYSAAIGSAVVNGTASTTLIGNRVDPDPNNHVVVSDGYFASTRQRYGAYSTVDNIVTIGVTNMQFTSIDFEQPAPNNYLLGVETFQFKTDINSTFEIVWRIKAFQPGTNNFAPLFYEAQLLYYNASTATSGLVATDAIIRRSADPASDNFDGTYTMTYILHTSNTPGDYVQFPISLIARPGNPSIDFSSKLFICRLN